MSLPIISVIIPVYNVELYLNEALLSIFNQSFKNYEVIAIDDGSTDSSGDILDNWAEKFDNLYIYHQKNRGLSAVRNRGVELSRGKYIYFMDSDDYIEENALETMVKECEINDLDLLLFGGSNFYDSDYDKQLNSNYNYERKVSYPTQASGQTIFSKLILNDEYFSSACLYITKKDLLITNNLFFEEGIIHEDELFTFQTMMISKKCKVINQNLFNRRLRANSIITSKNYLKSFIGYLTVLRRMLTFSKSIKLESSKIKKSVYKKIGQIYGFALNKYIKLDKVDKKLEDKKMLRNLGYENNFFYRPEFFVFYLSETIYHFLFFVGRKIVNIGKSRI